MSMWNQNDRLLVERSRLASWLGLSARAPQAYRTRNGDILMLLEAAGPKGWDDDDIAADEEDDDEEEEDELFPDDDADDLDDDEDEDDADEEEE